MQSLAARKANPRSGYWLKKADELWKQIIHAEGKCAIGSCLGESCSARLEAHHLITRSHRSKRHMVENGILLCCLHHKLSLMCSAHKAPTAFQDWMDEHKPDQMAWVRANQWDIGRPDYREAYEQLLDIWEELNG